MIEKLELIKLLQEDEYSNWGSNKTFNENIIDKLNEIIDTLNN